MPPQQNIPNHHPRLQHHHHPNNLLPMPERNQEDSDMKHYTLRVVVTEVSEAQPAKRDQYGNVKSDATQRGTRSIYESVVSSSTVTDSAQALETISRSYRRILDTTTTD